MRDNISASEKKLFALKNTPNIYHNSDINSTTCDNTVIDVNKLQRMENSIMKKSLYLHKCCHAEWSNVLETSESTH